MSILTRLLASFMTIIALPMFFVVGLTLVNVKRELEDSARARIQLITEFTSGGIEQILQKQRHAGLAVIDTSEMAEVTARAQARLGKTGVVFIVRRLQDEVVIVSPADLNPGNTSKIVTTEGGASPIEQAVSGVDGSGKGLDNRGRGVLVAWSHSAEGWGVVAKVDTDEALSGYLQIKTIASIMGSIAFLMAALMAFVISRSITDPIKELVDLTDRIGEGDLGARANLDTDGEIVHLGSRINIMTEKIQRLTEGIREQVEIVAQAESLARSNAELEIIAYAVSKDLKAPLREIESLSKSIERDLGERLEGETRAHMDTLRARVQRMGGLLDGLLEYARVHRLSEFNEEVDSKALLGEAIALLDVPDGYSIDLAGEFPTFIVAPAAMQRVFMNLLSNSIKHHDSQVGHVWIGVRESGPFYEFSVADDGPGIAPKFQERVFQMLKTLKPGNEVEGAGMGLTFVRRIMATVGGSIQFVANEGRGATFLVSWPKEAQGWVGG